jgi:isoleucyl-tRNA synthetase
MLKNDTEILNLWTENQIYEKSQKELKDKKRIHLLNKPYSLSYSSFWDRVLTTQIKDTLSRFELQKDVYVQQIVGWNTHGVIAEALVEEELELGDKREIEEKVGIEEFNDLCKQKVFSIESEWRKLAPGFGSTINLDNQFKSTENNFIESVWWGLGQLWKKGLIYKDYRISLYSSELGIPISHTDSLREVDLQESKVNSPVVRFTATKESANKLTKTILEEVSNSYSEQQRDKMDIEKKIDLIKNQVGKERKASLREILKSGKPEFSGIEWENFKTDIENSEEVINLENQLEIIHQNIDTLGHLKNILSGEHPLNILVWVPESWTVAANSALIIDPEAEYSLYYLPGSAEIIVVAEEKAVTTISLLFKDTVFNSPNLAEELKNITDSQDFLQKLDYDIVKIVTATGKDLEGLEYRPLFEIEKEEFSYEQRSNLYKVYSSPKTELTEKGTGIFHISGYCHDSFDVIRERNLPIISCLNDHGEISLEADVKLKPILGKKIGRINSLMIELLDKYGQLFGEVETKQKLPYLKKTKERLYYRPQESWYIAENKIRDKLSSQSQNTEWSSEYALKEFRSVLENSKDWSFSRKRYWGTPLPIWSNEDNSKVILLDSLEKLLKYTINPTYKILNTRDLKPEYYEQGKTVIVTDSQNKLPLGIAATQYRSRALSDLRKEKEVNIQRFAYYAQKILDEVIELFEKYEVVQLMFEEEEQLYWTIWLLTLHPDSEKKVKEFYFFREVETPVDLEEVKAKGPIRLLDLHRPIIDKIFLKDQVENIYTRVEDVLDDWVERGSASWAMLHYPFENRDRFEEITPFDISIETKSELYGWYKILFILYAGIFETFPVKKCKLVGNFVHTEDELEEDTHSPARKTEEYLQEYGSDTLRLSLFSSAVTKGEDSTFKEEDLEKFYREVTLPLINSAIFLENLRHNNLNERPPKVYKHPLNKWWQANTIRYSSKVNEYLEDRDIYNAARMIPRYIDDLSGWYIRRCKDLPSKYNLEVQACLEESLKLFAVSTSPLQPFNTEIVWSAVRKEGDPQSIHLLKPKTLPDLEEKQNELLEKMTKLRELASDVHAIRKENQVRVRQPLYADLSGLEMEKGLLELLKSECNLLDKDLSRLEGQLWQKKYPFGKIKVDLVIDKELSVLGHTRDFERAVQSFRKSQGFENNKVISMKWQLEDIKDEDVLQDVLRNVDWDKLRVEIKWIEKLSTSKMKKIQVKDLVTILVEQ